VSILKFILTKKIKTGHKSNLKKNYFFQLFHYLNLVTMSLVFFFFLLKEISFFIQHFHYLNSCLFFLFYIPTFFLLFIFLFLVWLLFFYLIFNLCTFFYIFLLFFCFYFLFRQSKLNKYFFFLLLLIIILFVILTMLKSIFYLKPFFIFYLNFLFDLSSFLILFSQTKYIFNFI